MFSDIGWFEILVILIVALVVLGPERLPGLIKEIRAVLLAIRTAVADARAQLDGEFGEELKEFSKPLQELNSVRQMGARGLITKTLLDGDDSFLTPLEATKRELKDTVEQARITKPNFRDALRQPVQQQAEAGESAITQDNPIQMAAQDLAQKHNGDAIT